MGMGISGKLKSAGLRQTAQAERVMRTNLEKWKASMADDEVLFAFGHSSWRGKPANTQTRQSSAPLQQAGLHERIEGIGIHA